MVAVEMAAEPLHVKVDGYVGVFGPWPKGLPTRNWSKAFLAKVELVTGGWEQGLIDSVFAWRR